VLPCLIFEDEHLLVVNKPAGMNTHSPAPFAGEGMFEWLRNREPRWTNLAIMHRLDKETSGVLVFAKSSLANRSLTSQFTEHKVRKTYLLLTDVAPRRPPSSARTALVRAGAKYISRPVYPGGEIAETRFRSLSAESKRLLGTPTAPGLTVIEAEPVTGKTHQIRVHAAELGFPILGDTLYGGRPAQRVCLHAAKLSLTHPSTGEPLNFAAPVEFSADASFELRRALIDRSQTTAFRLVHGESDRLPGVYVDKLGDHLLVQSERSNFSLPEQLRVEQEHKSVYFRPLLRQVRRAGLDEASPRLVEGLSAPDPFTVRENGITYELSFSQGYSVGLFLDQRDNRRRLLTRYIAPDFALRQIDSTTPWAVLNTFAYTCAFSVCAASSGARTTSLDLSKKSLDWGKRNFLANGLDPAQHDFIYGDVFDWLRRFARKGRLFDLVLIDPPTFSRSKPSGVFRAERDYGKLVIAALAVTRPHGVLFCSTNAAEWRAEDFLAEVLGAIQRAGHTVLKQHYVPQPPDFPVSRCEPAYLKTVWLRVS
jgi:23S rRNA (cytosine1962-C5)-methyltransferase